MTEEQEEEMDRVEMWVAGMEMEVAEDGREEEDEVGGAELSVIRLEAEKEERVVVVEQNLY